MLEHSEYESVHYWQTARSYFGRHLYITGFYLIGDALIDCGPANALPLLRKLFHDLPARRIVITHHHEDHTGNLKYLKNTHGLHGFAHPLAQKGFDDVSKSIPFYRQVVWGRPESIPMEPVPGEIKTESCTFQVLETPGHAADHICLYEPDRGWLFTGDLYLSSYLRYLRSDENIYEIMQSLKKMIELRPRILFCNHRGPVENAEAALAKKLSFLENIRDQVFRAVEKGIPLNEVIDENFKKDWFFRWFSAGELSTLNLVYAFAQK